MPENRTTVPTYYGGFPQAHPPPPPSTRRSGRTREPRHSSRRSDREHRGEGGRGGWGLGKPVVVRRDRRTGTRQAAAGQDSPIGLPKAPPAPPARWNAGDCAPIVTNSATTRRGPPRRARP